MSNFRAVYRVMYNINSTIYKYKNKHNIVIPKMIKKIIVYCQAFNTNDLTTKF